MPELTDHWGTCETHGARRSENVHPVRTRLECRCGWADNFTTVRPLQVYGMAVHAEMSSIPVTGATRTRR